MVAFVGYDQPRLPPRLFTQPKRPRILSDLDCGRHYGLVFEALRKGVVALQFTHRHSLRSVISQFLDQWMADTRHEFGREKHETGFACKIRQRLVHGTIGIPILKRALILHRLSPFLDGLVTGTGTEVFNGRSARDESRAPVYASQEFARPRRADASRAREARREEHGEARAALLPGASSVESRRPLPPPQPHNVVRRPRPDHGRLREAPAAPIPSSAWSRVCRARATAREAGRVGVASHLPPDCAVCR